MSYCRWSTVLPNNYESDLYIYDHVDGFISVNVAGARRAGIENAPRSALSQAGGTGVTDEDETAVVLNTRRICDH